MMLLLVVICNSAMAKWIVYKEDSIGIDYVDSSSIRMDGSTVKIWFMTDYKTLMTTNEGLSYKSKILKLGFDCTNWKYRYYGIEMNSGNMAEGVTVDSVSHISEWKIIDPGSIGETMREQACGKDWKR